MPDLSPAARKALAYWPQIEAAARMRMPTADLWAAIREASAAMGMDSPGVGAAGVSALRGYAGRIQRTTDHIDRADRSDRLDHTMAVEAPWSRGLGEREAFGQFQVRYLHTFTGPDGEQTEWRTSMFSGALPGTVGELLDAVDEDAGEMAKKYNVDHGGVSSLQVMAV